MRNIYTDGLGAAMNRRLAAVSQPMFQNDPYSMDSANGPSMAVNVQTRGPAGDYGQIGILTGEDGKILPLYGRKTAVNRGNFQYFTTTDGFRAVRLPLQVKGRNCTDSLGCTELYDGDSVYVAPLKQNFAVSTYGYDLPNYVPY
jgi:hypothetical protein